jgi:hypothetical protein
MNPIRNPVSTSRNQSTSFCRIELSLLYSFKLGEVTQCPQFPFDMLALAKAGLDLVERRWWTLTRPSSSHLTTASSSLACLTVPNSPVGFPKLPRPSTRSPGINSWSVAAGSESGGLLARSESGIAPACDKGGWGALRSLGVGLLVRRVIAVFPCGRRIALSHDCSSARSIQDRPGRNGSADPNCTVLTISLTGEHATAARSALRVHCVVVVVGGQYQLRKTKWESGQNKPFIRLLSE